MISRATVLNLLKGVFVEPSQLTALPRPSLTRLSELLSTEDTEEPQKRSKITLTGARSIRGYPVKCISPEWLVKFHSGYELDENDYHDVSVLYKRFGIALPVEYERF